MAEIKGAEIRWEVCDNRHADIFFHTTGLQDHRLSCLPPARTSSLRFGTQRKPLLK
jgi:hypothetical protein